MPRLSCQRVSGTSAAATPAVVRKQGTEPRLERLLELVSEVQETWVPLPVVAHVGEPLVVQLVAAIERQLQVLIGKDLLSPESRNLEGAGRARQRLDHGITDRTSGGGQLRPDIFTPRSGRPTTHRRLPPRVPEAHRHACAEFVSSGLVRSRLWSTTHRCSCSPLPSPVIQSGSASGPGLVILGPGHTGRTRPVGHQNSSQSSPRMPKPIHERSFNGAGNIGIVASTRGRSPSSVSRAFASRDDAP